MIQTKIFLHTVRMNLGIEPVLLLYSGLQSIVSNGLLKDVFAEKICGDTNCTSQELGVISSYHLYYRLLETVPSILPCLILGGWSDYHGRLPLVMTVLCGDLLKNLVILSQATTSWDASYILIASGISGITGNWSLMMLACLARGCDSTDPRWRTLKLGCLLGLWWLGQGCGFVTIAYRTTDIAYSTQYLVTIIVICIVACIEILLIVYTNVFVQETVPDFGDYNGSGWRTIVVPVHISSTVNSIFKQRIHNARCCLFLLLGLILMNDVVIYGEQAVSYRYLSTKLPIIEFSYNLIYGGAVIFSSITVVVFLLVSKRYDISDTTLGIAGALLTMTASLLLSAITKHIVWPAYLVPVPFIFSLLVPTITLSLLSKVVHTSEIGSTLACVAIIYSVAPLIAEVLYIKLYAASTSLPGLVYLISIILSLISALLFLFMKKVLNPCFGIVEGTERVPLINHSESYQGTVM